MSVFNPATGVEDTIGSTLPSVTGTTPASGTTGRAEAFTAIENVDVTIESQMISLYEQVQTLQSTVNSLSTQVTAITVGGFQASTPANTAVPVISNTSPVVGALILATPGAWSNTPTGYAYQWKRGGTAISGATSNSYSPVTGDIGNTLTVTVTASNTAGSSPATSAATAAVVAAAGGVPVNSAVPTISGTTTVGSVLTATTGTWSNTPTAYTYVWFRAGTIIVGAVAATYTTQTADAGSTLTVTVTASNTAGPASATSAATSAIVGLPVDVALPAITGTAQVGNTLTVSNGTWS